LTVYQQTFAQQASPTRRVLAGNRNQSSISGAGGVFAGDSSYKADFKTAAAGTFMSCDSSVGFRDFMSLI